MTDAAISIEPTQPRSYLGMALILSVLSHCVVFIAIWSTVQSSVHQWLTTERIASNSNILDVAIVPYFAPDDNKEISPAAPSAVLPKSEPQSIVASNIIKLHEPPKKLRETEKRATAPKEAPPVAAEQGATSGKKIEQAGDIVDAQILGIVSEYPRYSRQHHQEGRVVLKVDINADGKVTRTDVMTSSGFPLLDEAAEKALDKANFPPNRLLASSNLIAFRFKLIDG